jgi:hypothetical protein
MTLRHLLLTTTVALAAASLTATPATAATSLSLKDAVGCSQMSGFGYSHQGVSISIPTSWMCHAIVGSGLTIRSQEAFIDSVLSVASFCNYRFDWKYYDTKGKLQFTDTGTTNHGCVNQPARVKRTPRTIGSYGTACAVFYVVNKERTRQCHQIAR